MDKGEKLYKVLFLSATVHDHQFTGLHFYAGNGPVLSAYVHRASGCAPGECIL